MTDIYEHIMHYKKEGKDCVLITAVDKTGEGPVEVGKKLLVGEDGTMIGTVGGGNLEYHAVNKAGTLFKSRQNVLEKYLLNKGEVVPEAKTLPMVCGGVVTLFYEFIGAKEYVYLFGAGHVSQALAKVLKTMDFHLTVIDEREVVLEKFDGADRKVLESFATFIDNEPIRDDSFIVVCTPSHKYDYHVINKVLERSLKPKYMGMLCSLKKLREYIDRTYETFGREIDLSNFYSPIGLDIGGGSPEEIAISIASEMLAVSHGKTGHKHMRETADDKHRYWED